MLQKDTVNIKVQNACLDISGEIDWLTRAPHSDGAIATFIGKVRENQEQTLALELEHYPGMTEQALRGIVDTAFSKWPIHRVSLLHRVGRVNLGENIVFVGVSSPHRSEAFSACEFIMDALKTKAPFWKKAITEEGEHWVKANSSDTERMRRW